jgi:TRAP-type C4-dicarboxylate transport system substrate-binding protein
MSGIAAATTVFIGTGRARAADFTLKHNHNLPTDSPLAQARDRDVGGVKAETNGRVDVQSPAAARAAPRSWSTASSPS